MSVFFCKQKTAYEMRISDWSSDVCSSDLKEKHYVLATIHRAENTDHSQRLQVIVDALSQIAEQLPVIWPLHPRTKGALHNAGLLAGLEGKVRLTEPLGYMDIVDRKSVV